MEAHPASLVCATWKSMVKGLTNTFFVKEASIVPNIPAKAIILFQALE